MKKISLSVLGAAFIVAVLNACGGGGSDASNQTNGSTGSTTRSGTAGNDLFAQPGTYVLACKSDGDQSSLESIQSNQGTIVITPNAATGKAEARAHYQYYKGSGTCDPSALKGDLTVSGSITAKGATKYYPDVAGKAVIANVVTFNYSSMTLSKGNLSGGIPSFGTPVDMAYFLDGNTLYLNKGHREADGLGDSISRGLTRQ